MSTSRQEEALSALWAISALLAFGFGHEIWGWIFTVKAASDSLIAMYFAAKELRDEVNTGNK